MIPVGTVVTGRCGDGRRWTAIIGPGGKLIHKRISGPAAPRAGAPGFGVQQRGSSVDESAVATGIEANADGGYTALTRTESKEFKTLAGATKWLAKRGYGPHGERIERKD